MQKKLVHPCRKQHPLAARLQLCRCLVSFGAPSPSPTHKTVHKPLSPPCPHNFTTLFPEVGSASLSHHASKNCTPPLSANDNRTKHRLDRTDFKEMEKTKKVEGGGSRKSKAITKFTFCFVGVKEIRAAVIKDGENELDRSSPPLLWQLFLTVSPSYNSCKDKITTEQMERESRAKKQSRVDRCGGDGWRGWE